LTAAAAMAAGWMGWAARAQEAENTQTTTESAPAEAAEGRAYKDAMLLNGAIINTTRESKGTCMKTTVGKSAQGRDILAMRLALEGSVEPDKRSALLITSGLEGDLIAGSEVALGIAQRLIKDANEGNEEVKKLLTEHTVYVIPRVNMDAAETYFAAVKEEHAGNYRQDDPDRDGAMDEDGPEDLNGDGVITMMRVIDPEKADSLANPNDARINLKADATQGLAPAFVVYTEGTDNDNDGEYNEDGAGGVDINRNFMHNWKQYDAASGPYPASEPETLAMLRFVLAHQNIAAVITYGRQDNLVKTPSADPKDAAGAPINLDGGDVGLYKAIGEKYRDLTGIKDASSAENNGAFFAWAYAQFGVPAFTSSLWARPEVKEEPKKEEPQKAQDVAPEGAPAAGEGEAAAGGEAQAVEGTPAAEQPKPEPPKEEAKKEEKKDEKKKDYGDGEELAWLKYNDVMREGSGFIAWQKFDHPQLGEVEIGGWRPFFKTTPPAEELEGIIDAQYKFVLDIGTKFPTVTLAEPKVTRLGSNLFEIKTRVSNSGFLPAGTAMAERNQRARPIVVRLSTPTEDVLTGQRVSRVWRVGGSGGKEEFRWIVSAVEGSTLTITAASEKYGTIERVVELK